jgi:hypothetical protein
MTYQPLKIIKMKLPNNVCENVSYFNDIINLGQQAWVD